MENFAELERLQRAVSTLVGGLNAQSIDLDTYLIFEDMTFNNDYDLAIDILNSGNLKISNEDKIALLFVYENAYEKYNQISSLDPLR